MYLLGRLFRLRTDEHKKSRYLIAMFLFIGFYNTMIESTSLTVFNSRLGPDHFPLVYMMFPFFNLGISAAFLPLVKRVPKQRLFKYFIFSIAGLHLMNFAIVLGIYNLKYVYLFLVLSCMLVVENMIFLSMLMLQDFVSIESIKRLLPLATASITAGAVLAAVVIKSTAGLIPLWLTFVLATLLLFGALYAGEILYKKYKTINFDEEEPVEGGASETMRYIWENPFFTAVIMVSMLVVVVYTVNDYLFNTQATAFFPDESRLFAFIGETEAFQYITAFIIEVFVFTRVISKIGSTNMVKVVLANIVLSMAMMLGSSQFIVLLMVSRVICKEFILEMNYSVSQIFYQPANPRYRETLLVIHNIAVGFLGCIAGGVVTILHANGVINTLSLTLLPIVLTVPAYALWHYRQNGFIAVIEKTMNSGGTSKGIDIAKITGEIGLNKFVLYISEKIAKARSADIVFALELIKTMDFKEKEELIKCAFQKGSAEARMRIIDLYFDRHAPVDTLIGCIEAMDGKLCGYLLEKLILEYGNIEEGHRPRIVEAVERCFWKEDLNEFSLAIYEYLCEGKKQSYGRILGSLNSGGSNGDFDRLLRIICHFTDIEEKSNEKYVKALTKDLRGRRSLLGNVIEAAAYYDSRYWDMSFLEEVLPEYCDYEVIEKACACYGPDTLNGCFSKSKGLVQQVFYLYTARHLEPCQAKVYIPVYENALKNLKALISGKTTAGCIEGPGKNILIEEMERVIQTASAVLIDYAFIVYGIPVIANINKHIADKEKREMVFEMVRNSLPLKPAEELIKVLDGESDTAEKGHIPGHYIGSRTITGLWRNFSGHEQEEGLKEEYERLNMLKSVPLFSALDFDMLYCIDKIAKAVKCSKGDMIIRKGDKADCFYVVYEGELGVYLNSRDKRIALLSAGDIAGELAVLDKGLRTADVVCETDAVLFVFNGEELTDMMEKNGDIALCIMKMLSERLRGMLA